MLNEVKHLKSRFLASLGMTGDGRALARTSKNRCVRIN